MKIDVKKWKEFTITSLFYISRGKTLTLENKSIYIGSIPCINGSGENNGVFGYLNSNISEIGFKQHKAPSLTLSRVGNSGKTFVQSENYFIADNAFSLTLKNEDDILVYIFISTVLNLEVNKYSYGRTIAIEKYKQKIIKLPSTKENQPDYEYMKNYMHTLNHKQIKTEIKSTNEPIEIIDWSEFFLDELFIFVKGKRLTKADMIDGKINYLGAISENNGVRQHIDVEDSKTYRGNCITVNYNGSVGEAFYQSEPFWASDDVNVLYAKDWTMNKFNALFIITVIKANRYRFSYGRKWTLEKMKESIIKLPVTKQDSPDFYYMENYIKSLAYSDRI